VPRRKSDPTPDAWVDIDHVDWRRFDELELPPVLSAALEAFVEHGYHGATIRDISKRLGATIPTIYYRYENKQDLLFTLMRGFTWEVLVRSRAAVRAAGDDPVAQLENLVTMLTLFAIKRRALAFLDRELNRLDPQNRATCVAIRDEVDSVMRTVIEEGRARGEFHTRYPREAIRAIQAMCQAVAYWYNSAGELSPDEVAERCIALALAIVRTPNDPPPGIQEDKGREGHPPRIAIDSF
jgi:AcrR family transcriptional regulator